MHEADKRIIKSYWRTRYESFTRDSLRKKIKVMKVTKAKQKALKEVALSSVG
jgi:hypothetical protein